MTFKNNYFLPGLGTRWYSSADVKLSEAKLGRPGPGMTSGYSWAVGRELARLTAQRVRATRRLIWVFMSATLERVRRKFEL